MHLIKQLQTSYHTEDGCHVGAFQPLVFAASAMGNAALAPSEEDTLTAPGRSVRRFLNPERAPGLSGVRGGGENVEIQTSFVGESLETMAGLSGMLNDGESSTIMSGFVAESLHAAASWRCTGWR